MSVYPEFVQYIHDQGLYVPGYNYEEMYNIMIHNLTYNIIPTTNFIYTYQQINELYECLEELLMPIDSDLDETNQIHPETNVNPQMNLQMNNQIDDLDDIYDSEDEIQVINETPNTQTPITETPNAQIVFNNYIQMLNNAANMTANMNHINTNNINNMNNYYTNLTYYNNINTHNTHNTYNSPNVITYNNNT